MFEQVLDPTKPLETPALLEQRYEQRRTVVYIGDFAFGLYLRGGGMETDPERITRPFGELSERDRIEAEIAVRAKADELLDDDDVRAMLARMRERVSAEAMILTTNELKGIRSEILLGLRREAGERAEETAIDDYLKEPGSSRLREAVRLLLLADSLADDGYTDPRLPGPEPFAVVLG